MSPPDAVCRLFCLNWVWNKSDSMALYTRQLSLDKVKFEWDLPRGPITRSRVIANMARWRSHPALNRKLCSVSHTQVHHNSSIYNSSKYFGNTLHVHTKSKTVNCWTNSCLFKKNNKIRVCCVKNCIHINKKENNTNLTRSM